MYYHMYAGTASGPKYIEKGWECQDRSETLAFDGTQIILVADGHGSGDCFRSDVGAQLAIESAIIQTWRYRASDTPGDSRYVFSDRAIEQFKHSIWNEWRQEVKKHWNKKKNIQRYLGEGEIRYESVSEKYKRRYERDNRGCSERYLYTAYGTTLLLAISSGKQILVLQIGDGTCAVLKQNGEFCCPVEADEDNCLNVVVSICEDDAYKKIRHAVLDCDEKSGDMPVAIFLSSDGLDDCYPVYENENYLYKLYSIIVESILRNGFDATEEEITDELLPGLTARGSKDDISVAYLISTDMELLDKAFNSISSEYSRDNAN